MADWEEYVGGLSAAQKIHRTAAHYAAQVLSTIGRYHQSLNAAGVGGALSNPINFAAISGTTGKLPNWVMLFGDVTKCACKECQTVLSPGAYLVDLPRSTTTLLERALSTYLIPFESASRSEDQRAQD